MRCGCCDAVRGRFSGRRARPRIYDEAERNALILLWDAYDRVCGKRLKALLPVLLERWNGTVILTWRPKSGANCWR